MSCYRTAGRSPTLDRWAAAASRSRRRQEGAARRSPLRFTVGSSARGSPPNTSAPLASNWFFQSVIWSGCMSCCCASSASVLSPQPAASATLALNAAECVRRGLLLIFAPVLTGDVLAFRSSVHPHRAVQFHGASSDRSLCGARLEPRLAPPGPPSSSSALLTSLPRRSAMVQASLLSSSQIKSLIRSGSRTASNYISEGVTGGATRRGRAFPREPAKFHFRKAIPGVSGP